MLDWLPIRWRLAVISAALTLVILTGFAVLVGQLTVARIRADFSNEMATAVAELVDRAATDLPADRVVVSPDLDLFAAPNDAVIRVIDARDQTVLDQTNRAPDLGVTPVGVSRSQGYRVETRAAFLLPVRAPFNSGLGVPVTIQYARRVSDVESTVARVRLFLLGGVLGGAGLALLGGVVLGGRALRPITALTAAAHDVATTRDPRGSLPVPGADDEVAELARTLRSMLDALEGARDESEETLARQRQFVADASHELRTPLTSILANLELLVDVLEGEPGEAARSALRSSNRMRRLVGDLLLLARADARRAAPHEPTDVGRVLVDAAAELEPVADDHELSVEAHTALVAGARDELHRLALNLMENALRHTPPGTRVHASVAAGDGEVVLVVEDDGPGVPAELRHRVFERFVRGGGDQSGSAGLGLSIVSAVAESHGGSVTLEDAGPGARFVVRLPRAYADLGAPSPA